MNFAQALTSLNAAAKETLQRIAQDRQKAPPKIKPLLSYIESNLFHPDLRVGQLKRACGIRDNSISMQFHAALGTPPSSYIEQGRMEIASRLLKESEVPVSMIAELLGYSSLQVFSTAFNRWAGMRPNPFREHHRAEAEKAAANGDEMQNVETLRRALMGSLNRKEAQLLLQYLQDLYSTQDTESDGWQTELRPLHTETDQEIDLEEEQKRADAIWLELKMASPEKQRQLVRSCPRFYTTALFDLLRRKIREEGRDHRERGVQIAELALESLLVNEQHSLLAVDEPLDLDRFANLKARAWANIGQARRLALDFSGAEKAFELAEAYLPTSNRSRRVVAELHHLKANLRWYQRRYEEALALENRAIPLLRLIGDPHPLAEALLSRAAINYSSADHEASLPDLQEALRLIDERQAPYLMLAAYSSLADTYTRSGHPEQAQALLPKAKQLAEQVGCQSVFLHLLWSEGLVRQQQGDIENAEESFSQARRGFLELQESAQVAMVSLDLAILFAEQKRYPEALELATEVAPFFAAMNNHHATHAVLSILNEAIAAQEVSSEILEQVRHGFDQVCRDPVVLQSERPS